MAKIVIDGREILGTTGRYIRKLLEYLQEIDSENEYHVLLHQKGYEETQFSKANFHKVLVRERKFSFAEQLSLPATIKALKPDLVHFTMTNQPVFLDGKVITTIHDLTPVRFRNLKGNPLSYKLKSIIFAWVIKKAANKSRYVFTGTQYAKNDIIDFTGMDATKITITSEAADKMPGPTKQIDKLAGKNFIFYAGRAQPHKNLEKLVEAFEILHTSQPELKLVLAGKREHYYEELEKLASKSPASANIVFTGFVSDAELKWLYENAQAYVFPSLSEGFGLPGLEAMVHGCPVISSNATCLPEVYGNAALYFDPTNPQDMADKINEVVSNEKMRSELVNKGHAQAKKYSWRQMAQQTLEIYQQALKD